MDRARRQHICAARANLAAATWVSVGLGAARVIHLDAFNSVLWEASGPNRKSRWEAFERLDLVEIVDDQIRRAECDRGIVVWILLPPRPHLILVVGGLQDSIRNNFASRFLGLWIAREYKPTVADAGQGIAQ